MEFSINPQEATQINQSYWINYVILNCNPTELWNLFVTASLFSANKYSFNLLGSLLCTNDDDIVSSFQLIELHT